MQCVLPGRFAFDFAKKGQEVLKNGKFLWSNLFYLLFCQKHAHNLYPNSSTKPKTARLRNNAMRDGSPLLVWMEAARKHPREVYFFRGGSKSTEFFSYIGDPLFCLTSWFHGIVILLPS